MQLPKVKVLLLMMLSTVSMKRPSCDVTSA